MSTTKTSDACTVATDAILAAYLSTTRNTISLWRKRYPDAPATKDVFEWQDFCTRHGITPMPIGRPAVFRRAFEGLGEGLLLMARTNARVRELSPKAALKYGEVMRSKINPAVEQLYDIIESCA